MATSTSNAPRQPQRSAAMEREIEQALAAYDVARVLVGLAPVGHVRGSRSPRRLLRRLLKQDGR